MRRTVKINIPLFLLPAGSKEGDILDITIARDVQETEDAKERVSSLLEKLKNKNQGMIEGRNRINRTFSAFLL